MNKQIVEIWGRSFELDVIYDRYDNEQITSVQQETLKRILDNLSIIDSAKEYVAAYCLQNNSKNINQSKIENIFKYVMPKSFYIQRTKDDSRIIALLCNYKFDMENGLAIIFKNEQLHKIGSQNIIL